VRIIIGKWNLIIWDARFDPRARFRAVIDNVNAHDDGRAEGYSHDDVICITGDPSPFDGKSLVATVASLESHAAPLNKWLT
jgi:class 3 adenylate cyclase